jgi:hypothetical protein
MTQGARKSTTYILKSKSNKMTQGARKSTTYILKSKSNKMTQGAECKIQHCRNLYFFFTLVQQNLNLHYVIGKLSIINGVFSTNEVNFPIDTLKCTNF